MAETFLFNIKTFKNFKKIIKFHKKLFKKDLLKSPFSIYRF